MKYLLDTSAVDSEFAGHFDLQLISDNVGEFSHIPELKLESWLR